MSWIRPGAQPLWGHADGLQVGLAPLPGPRGLLRIYTPYLGHEPGRMLNFVAVEPIPAGAAERGLSELERSVLDDQPGLRFWSADDPAIGDPQHLAPGVVDTVDGVERLTVYILVERFANGADVYVRVRFTADRPHEVALAGFRRDGSVPLDTLILTATMGNYARLRELHLADRVVRPADLWPGFGGDGFTDHARFGLAELDRDQHGAATVAATPDETDPTSAVHADGTHEHWRYAGARARQTWRVPDPHPDLEVLVNGRFCYWASTSPIPGGVSFENFEISEPFQQGQEYIFGVDKMP